MEVKVHFCRFVRPAVRSTRWIAIEISTGEKGEPSQKRRRVASRAAIGLCLDVSGSMRGRAMDNLKRAAKAVVDRFDADQIEIVTFARRAEVMTPSAKKEDTKAEIEALRAAGPTAMLDGLRTALKRMKANHSEKGTLRRLFLLTDGHPNIPEASSRDSEGAPNTICTLAGAARGKLRCPITTFGLGDDYASELLKNIASLSGGEFYDVASSEAIPETIGEAAAFLHAVLYTECRLEVRGIGDGQVVSIFGCPDRTPWSIGDLYRGDRSTVLVNATCPGTEGPFLTWKLTGCKVGDSERRVLAEGEVSARVSLAEPIDDPDPVKISRLLFQISDRARAVVEQLNLGEHKEAQKLQRALIADLEVFEGRDAKVRIAVLHQRQVLRAIENMEFQRARLYHRHSQHYYGFTQRDSSYRIVKASSQSV